MKNPLILLAALVLAPAVHAAPLTLIENGAAKCKIYHSEDAAGAAEELQTYLEKISGATVPIQRSDFPPHGPAILLGNSPPARDSFSLPKRVPATATTFCSKTTN